MVVLRSIVDDIEFGNDVLLKEMKALKKMALLASLALLALSLVLLVKWLESLKETLE